MRRSRSGCCRSSRSLSVPRAVLDEQLRLAVVGIGARVEQEPGELLPLRVRRLVDRALLTLAEGSRQRGEPAVAAPHVAGVRIRAAFNEKAHRGERRPAGQIEPGVRRIEERLPVEPPAPGVDQRRVGVEYPRHLIGRAHTCGVPDVAHGQRWVPHEHFAGALPADRPVVVVVQAREVEEVRVFARDGLVDVGLQLPPSEEPVAVPPRAGGL